MSELVTIYGMKDRKGRFVYIGKTIDPDRREKTHIRQFPRCKFTRLETCSPDKSNALEQEIIRRFKSMGQAKENTNTGEVSEGIKNGNIVPITALVLKQKRHALKSKLSARGESIQDWLERLIDKEINWSESRAMKG